MADKQIIIDGIDVAGCEQRFGDNKCALLDQYFCENNSDCYYKQLKRTESELARKEQECEELKKIIDEAKNSKLDLKSFLVGEAIQDEYKQQLDQLKAKSSILEDEYKILEDNLDSRTRDFEDVIDNYKQALAEIKEIAEKGDMPPCMQVDCNCTNCEDEVTEKGSRCMQYSLKQILQKINEVEDKNKNK